MIQQAVSPTSGCSGPLPWASFALLPHHLPGGPRVDATARELDHGEMWFAKLKTWNAKARPMSFAERQRPCGKGTNGRPCMIMYDHVWSMVDQWLIMYDHVVLKCTSSRWKGSPKFSKSRADLKKARGHSMPSKVDKGQYHIEAVDHGNGSIQSRPVWWLLAKSQLHQWQLFWA